MDYFRRINKPNSPQSAADVVLYCTPWCPSCRLAREWLKENRINYVEVDISRDRTAAARVRGWADGNETTPTFDIRGTIVVDWDERRMEELLIARQE
jgi:arsenate reductase-like glutaredoxin family protein